MAKFGDGWLSWWRWVAKFWRWVAKLVEMDGFVLEMVATLEEMGS